MLKKELKKGKLYGFGGDFFFFLMLWYIKYSILCDMKVLKKINIYGWFFFDWLL